MAKGPRAPYMCLGCRSFVVPGCAGSRSAGEFAGGRCRRRRKVVVIVAAALEARVAVTGGQSASAAADLVFGGHGQGAGVGVSG